MKWQDHVVLGEKGNYDGMEFDHYGIAYNRVGFW